MKAVTPHNPARHLVRRLRDGQAMHLGPHAGELVVMEGRLWLTRDADPGDHIIEPGHRVYLAARENAVIEAAFRNEAVLMYWTPYPRSVTVTVLAPALAATAQLAACAAAALTVMAAAAARVARHAQALRDSRRGGARPGGTTVEIVLSRP